VSSLFASNGIGFAVAAARSSRVSVFMVLPPSFPVFRHPA
jgi:hypothetical protein